MKKILLLGVIGLLLVGCGDKKVTSEMLLGDWSCDISTQKAIWRDGNFSNYSLPKNEKGKLRSFKIENDILYTNYNQKNWFEFNVNNIYKQPKYTREIKQLNVIEDGERIIKYISKNKFELRNDVQYSSNDKHENIKKISNMKVKTIEICSRIENSQ